MISFLNLTVKEKISILLLLLINKIELHFGHLLLTGLFQVIKEHLG